jgi:hypothetical protein
LILGFGIGAMPYEWDYLGEEPDARVRGPCSTRGSRYSRACGVANPSVTTRNTTGSQAIPTSRTGGLSSTPRRCSGHAFRSGSRAPGRKRSPFAAPRAGTGIPNEGRGRAHSANDAGRRAGNGTLRRKPPSGEQPFRVGGSRGTPGEDQKVGAPIVAAYVEAGVTWWMESIDSWRFGWTEGESWPSEEMRRRVRQGPPEA